MLRGIKSFFGQDFFHNSIVHWVLVVSLLLNLGSFLSIAYFIRPIDFPIILHYNVYFGVDVIGMWWHAYFLPVIGVIIYIVNVVLARFFYENRERIISYIFVLSLLMVQIGIAVATGGMVKINY